MRTSTYVHVEAGDHVRAKWQPATTVAVTGTPIDPCLTLWIGSHCVTTDDPGKAREIADAIYAALPVQPKRRA